MRAAPTGQVGPLDHLFLRVEDGVTHMHIACCATFEGPPPDAGDVLTLIATRLPAWPGYRRHLRFRRWNLGRPVWVDDPSFDLVDHVHHVVLPAPGGNEELNDLIGRLISVELDRRRPLWEVWVVDGLGGHRWALVTKIHHCLLDGIAGIDLLAHLLDVEPHPNQPSLPKSTPERPVDQPTERRRDQRWSGVRWLRANGRRPPHPRDVTIAARNTFAGALALGRRLRPEPSRLSIDGAIGPRRRWAAARSTLAELTTIRTFFGGTVNDVALAVIAGAFRDLLVARGDPVDDVSLRSLVPVSVRRPGDHTASNQIAAAIAELPLGIADPVERLISVRGQMSHLKGSHQTEATEAMTTLIRLTPPSLFSVGVRSAMAALRHVPQRSVHTVTTNVPGPQVPLYALGREMLEVLPCVPITQGLRIGVAVMSYNGQLCFGTTGDYDTVPEVAWFCERIEAGIAELCERTRQARHRPPSPALGGSDAS